ncbi:MAG TPA: aminotransferase [Xanthobacteraceae bacterium]|nr:aminotransferase [Xanthobacteraceae bacterium]
MNCGTTFSVAERGARTGDTDKWQALDRAHYLHPFTDHAALRAGQARVAVRGEGIHVWHSDGHRVIDGLSGLGCVNLGYGRPELVKAAAAQMQELSFCQSFFNTTHPMAVMLAAELARMLPGDINQFFFQSSGSEANETAVRLIRKYWDLRGEPQKRIIIARERAYHGSTAMAASLSGDPFMHQAGGDLPLPNITHIKTPYAYKHGAGMSDGEFGIVAAGWLEERIRDIGADNVAAFFGEPAQSAGGAICPPMTYWPEVERICRKYNVLLVADEVVCGFGRTGAWFGADHYGFTPDMMLLGKGLTSGYLPLSACAVSDRISEVLVAGGEWAHGFTYSGHPACCATALANIRVLRDEGIVGNVGTRLAPYFAEKIASLADHPLIGDVRSVGLMGGLEIVKNKAAREPYPRETYIGRHCSAEAWRRGLAFRANGDTMTLMPPLIISEAELDTVFSIARDSLDATARHFGVPA